MAEISEMKNYTLTLDEMAGLIKASWNKAVESVLETAQTLKDAEEQLPRRDFKRLKDMLQQDRIMSGPTITKLLKIASSDVLTAPENIPRLPPSYATLYELAHHEPNLIREALEQGKLHSATRRRELVDILPARDSKKMKSTKKIERISVSVRFSTEVGNIPDDVLKRLHNILTEIDQYTDVKHTGLK